MVGAAHAGLFLLLTTSARGEMAVLVARHGEGNLLRAEQPTATSPKDDVEARTLRRQQALWEDARRYDRHRHYVALLGYALLASFLLQASIGGVLLHRSLRSRRHAL